MLLYLTLGLFEDISGRWDWGDIEIIRVYREGERTDGVGWPWIEFVDRQTGKVLFKSYLYDEDMRISLSLEVYLRDFDGDGMDEALLIFESGGSGCCRYNYLVDRNWHDFRVVLKVDPFILDTIVDLDGDGDLELIFLSETFYVFTCNACQPIFYIVYTYEDGKWKCSRKMSIQQNARYLWRGQEFFSPQDSTTGMQMALWELQNVTFLIFSGRMKQAKRYFMRKWKGEDKEEAWERAIDDVSGYKGFECIYPGWRKNSQ